MLPINRKLKISAQIRIDLLVLTILAIFLELVICKGKFRWFVVEFVLPWLYVASIALVDFLMIFGRRKSRYYSSLIYCTLFSLLPQIMLWICDAAGWYESATTTDSFVFFCKFVALCVCIRFATQVCQRRNGTPTKYVVTLHYFVQKTATRVAFLIILKEKISTILWRFFCFARLKYRLIDG